MLTVIMYCLVTVAVLILAGSSVALHGADAIDGGVRSAVILSGVALLLFGAGRRIHRSVRRTHRHR